MKGKRKMGYTGDKRLNLVSVAACMVFACILFILIGQNKRISFCDEIYSYTITNSDRATYQFDTGRIYSRDEVVDMLSHTEGDSIIDTLKNVARDKVHPPLYYVLMYISSVILGGSSKWVGLAVNLVFLLGTVFLAWNFIFRITGSRVYGMLAVMVYLLNMSTLSDMMLVRMYMGMTFFAMALLYCDSRMAESGCTKRFYTPLALITAGGFLTQYYFAFFAVSFFAVELLLYWRRDRAGVKAYFLSMLAAVGIATVLWPLWIPSMVMNSHAGAMAESAFDFAHLFNKLYEAFRILQVSIFQRAYVFGMIFVVVLCFVFFVSRRVKNNRKNIRNLAMKAFSAAVLYTILVRILTPEYLTSARYYYPAQMLEIMAMLIMVYGLVAEYAGGVAGYLLAGIFLLFCVGDIFGYLYGYGIDYYGNHAVYDEHAALLEKYSDALWVITDNHSYQIDAMMAYFCIPEYVVVIDGSDEENNAYEHVVQLENVDKTIIVSLEYYTDAGNIDFSDRGMYYLIGSSGRFAVKNLLFKNDDVLFYEAVYQ